MLYKEKSLKVASYEIHKAHFEVKSKPPKKRESQVNINECVSSIKQIKKGKINDYRYVKKLGEGSFAKVKLFRCRKTG